MYILSKFVGPISQVRVQPISKFPAVFKCKLEIRIMKQTVKEINIFLSASRREE